MQKKILLFLSVCFFTLISNAQILKGTISPNFDIGNLKNVSITNKPHLTRNYISFNPGIGYFIKNNWEVGAGINFVRFHYEDKQFSFNTNNFTTFGIRLYSNYYFGKGKLKPFVSFQTGWEHTKGNYSTAGIKTDYNKSFFYTSIGGGLNWNIRKNVSLFAEAAYRRESLFSSYPHGSFNLTIGARFIINKKRSR